MSKPIHGGNLDWAASIAKCSVSQILDFSASINPLGIPKKALKAIQEGVKDLVNYPNPDYPEFRQSISHHHSVDYEYILPANGAAELLTWVAFEASRLEGVLLPSPCFADYRRAFDTFNVNCQFYSLTDLEEGLLKPSHQWGLLINNPHNPTGKVFSRDVLVSYLDKFALVIIDEAFMDFLPPEDSQTLISLVQNCDNLIIVRSLTKFYSLPGLRIGYGISNSRRVCVWYKWRDPWSVNTLAVLAGIASLKDREFQEKTWAWLPPAREKLTNHLNQISGLEVMPSGANFLLVKTKIPSSNLQLRLLKLRQILIRDCISFPELGEQFFRVAVKTDGDNFTLKSAIELAIS